MKRKLFTTILCAITATAFLSGCSKSTVIEPEPTAESIMAQSEVEETTPEPIVIETIFGSYTRLRENEDYPEVLEDVEIDLNGQIFQLSLPNDMGGSFKFDADSNSLFIYNNDKSKVAYIYFTEFLQAETYKVAYDTETMANMMTFDGFTTVPDTSVETLHEDDSLIIQRIPATISDYLENEYIKNDYTGEYVRHQNYDLNSPLELTGEDGTVSKAYTGVKHLFYYGETTDSSTATYITDSFNIVDLGTRSNLSVVSEKDINNMLATNTLVSVEEYVSQTSYLHSIKAPNSEQRWQSYVSLGLYRTQITDDMTLEEIQQEMKKSHVFVTIYRESGRASSGRGSGFVLDMDENFMYIATNQHVANMGWGSKYGYYIRFADDFEDINNLMEKHNVKGDLVGYTYNPDFAIIKCDISNIPYEDREVFKAIPKIEEVPLEVNMPVYMYHMTKKQNESLKTGSLYSTDKIAEIDGKIYYHISEISIDGDSGSMFFTQDGQCLGMLVGAKVSPTNNSRHDIIIPYDLIPTTFEEIVERPLYEEISTKEFLTQYMTNYWNEIMPE